MILRERESERDEKFTLLYVLVSVLSTDELLLVERREQSVPHEPKTEETAASSPTQQEITTATSQLPKKNHSRDPDAAHHAVDVSCFLYVLRSCDTHQ